MEYIKLTKENIDKEHICCALSDKEQVAEKKHWLAQKMDDGLVFYRLNEKGKVFIEYLPVEAACFPIQARNMMFIDCLWVSGKYKGKGYSSVLLNQCIKDASEAGMDGIVVISSPKKMSYLNDPNFLIHQGFQLCDEALPFQLYYLPIHDSCEKPSFLPNAKTMRTKEDGIVLYYTPQCPFALKYAQILKQRVEAAGIPIHLHLITRKEEANTVPAPWTVYALFVNHTYVTHEILSEKKIDQLIEAYGNQAN
ncbi:GNAT family N-acetyltransferase [[Eubacterium] hominis]|uniref:GNAT family N-acetyltransferase n=1 Tax=[Eubacterium] hominis TaxID=2764325 RepID=UPI003A4D82F9